MPRSPLWIAGIGAICAAGNDLPSILNSFELGKRNPTTNPADNSSITCPTFQVTADLPQLPARYNNSRSLRLAMHAVQEAMTQAGIKQFDNTTKVGVCIGTTVASQLNCIPFYEAYRRDGNPPLGPVYDYLHANLAQAISSLLNIHGPRMTIVNACSSGTDSIGIAAAWIRAGLCDIAIAGGADEINRVAIAGFHSLGVMSDGLCAPFDRDRTGLNLGEGAGILILESNDHAQRRNAKPNFQLAGFGQGSDAHHLTAPHPEGRGLESAITTALKMAEIEPKDISFINAHGTATTDNDRAEGNLLAKIFARPIPFLSTKGYTGHTLGAAGGLEAAFTVAALEKGWIPPSAGFQNQSDEIPITPVKEKTKITGQYAISTSLAFGGNNSAVIIRNREFSPLARSLATGTPTDTTPQQPAHILGIGAVTPLGRDLEIISNLLSQPPEDGLKSHRVPDQTLTDPALAKRLRRADRFTRMATLAAIDAWSAANKNFPDTIPPERIGLIIATGFGPHPRGFKFLDGILDAGDADALPTDFSHSVHGSAAAYITEILNLRGPSITTTDFEIPFEQSIQLAQCWLNENTCDRVLVGAVEELGEVMLHCVQKMSPDTTPGDGAIFLTLGKIESELKLHATDTAPQTNPKFADPPRGTFTPYFGRSPVDSAFQLLGTILTDSPSPGMPGEGLTASNTIATQKKLSDSNAISLILTRQFSHRSTQ